MVWFGWNLKRTESKYPCVNCGYWVEITMNKCPNCGHDFSADDLTEMIRVYEKNKNENRFSLVVPFIMVAAIILAAYFIARW